MRATTFILGTALALALVIPVAAQSFSTMFTGASPRDIKMVPIDTNKAIKSLNVNSAFRTPAPTKTFSLTNIFPKVQLGSWPPIVPSTPVVSQPNNIFQPNPILGKNPFAQTPAK